MTQHDNIGFERRDYFRVDDRVALRVRITNDPTQAVQVPGELQHLLALLDELRSIDDEQSVILRNISDRSRELGHYLKAQQRKMELIASHLVLQQVNEHFSMQEVNLSANGIGFHYPQALRTGQLIDLDLLIWPQATLICTRAKIVSHQQRVNDYVFGAEFTELEDHHRDAIVRHCLMIDGQKRRLERAP